MFRLLGFGKDVMVNKLNVLCGNEDNLARKISKKGGFYAKLAQAMEIQNSEHECFTKNTPLNSVETNKRTLQYQKQMGTDVIEIENEPSWFGSTAQVYRAYLPETDTSVILKVRYAGIEELVHKDMETFKKGIALVDRRKRFSQFVIDMQTTIEHEFDYPREIQYISYIHDIFQNENMGIIIPEVKKSLCTDKVLCMTQLFGKTLTSWKQNRSQEEKNKLGLKVCNFLYTLMNKYDIIYCDPHWSNFLIGEDGSLGVVDFGSISEVAQVYRKNRFEFHYACIEKDMDKFIKSATDMQLFKKDCPPEGKKYIYDYFVCHLEPFMQDHFTFSPIHMNRCKGIPFDGLNYINVKSHIYPFAKLSYNLNNLLCALNCSGNFKEIMNNSMLERQKRLGECVKSE